VSDLVYYVAGNFGEYNEYRRRKEKAGIDVSNWRYLSKSTDLRGLTEVKGFYIGSYEDREDIEDIRIIIEQIKGIPK
jgi:hypothetical protein